jgi:protein involved in polysaccharide export with SLBB domain
MKLKSLIALIACLFVLLLSAAAIAQTSDQLDALKQNLTPEEQQAILQGVTGQGTGSTTKTDPRLNMPQTVLPKNGDRTGFEQFPKERKTPDGHVLRQANEDLQLRADDSVLIELVPLYDLRTGVPCNYESNSNNNNNNNDYNENGDRNVSNCNNNNNVTNGNNGNRALTSNGVDLNALASGNANPSLNGNNGQRNNQNNQPAVRKQLYGKTKTDEERDRLEKFRKRILSNNPYRLNRFGVLEIPGLPSIPMAGLTAEEATERLNADPDLADFEVKLTLLRLEPFGQEALKPFGYDLFEGAPSTFAPVSDIQVPLDYVIGPGDRLDVQLYGNEPSTYRLTVQRDGRILFPKLGPIVVGELTFAQAQATIEQRVSQQLIGTRVSISMGDLRSIRVFVLGEAEKPGSYTVSGLSTMTNALFVSGGVKKIGSLRNIELKRDGRLVSVLDLYDLLLHGDTSGDRKLLPWRCDFHSAHRQHRCGRRLRAPAGDLRDQGGENRRAGHCACRGAAARRGFEARPGGTHHAGPLAANDECRLDATAERGNRPHQRRQSARAADPTHPGKFSDAVGLCISTRQV